MARLHEHQGKALLSAGGVSVPRGGVARTPDEAADVARGLGGSCVVKIQAWTTGRKAMGGVAFTQTPDEAREHARRMLAMRVGQFPVEAVLVEEQLRPEHELFVSLTVDDAARAPLLLLAMGGGSGIEERSGEVARIPCHVGRGPDSQRVSEFLAKSPLPGSARPALLEAVRKLFAVAQWHEARSLEVNPLAVVSGGRVVALDCRVTIDDYAVFRHPDLGIEIARELDHPPTDLERLAYRIEQEDHRGTFFFAQMNTQAPEGSAGLIGFHGAGGGGSMMSMDAITGEGFTLANFCDTSGNPSPAKVYRAARIILSQPGLRGYFGSGSGVANQEQYWSAYGLAKAFWEVGLDIPCVIRLGGNTEDRAVEILEGAARADGERGVPATVEGYKKNDPPAKIARRFAELVSGSGGKTWTPRPARRPGFVGSAHAASFPVKGGTAWVDLHAWRAHAPAIIARANGLLRDEAGRPTPTLAPAELAAKDSDWIACEVECRRDGIDGVFVELHLADGAR
jgi:succinyl-CoA synthetase beta subunit